MKLLLYGHLYVVALLNSAFLLMENKKKESKWVCVFASFAMGLAYFSLAHHNPFLVSK